MSLPYPEAMRQAINSFLREAVEALEKDVKEEKVSSPTLLTRAENFKRFYKNHLEDFEAFGCFVFDHRGAYDGKRELYDWKILYPVVVAIFVFGIKMPHRSRLIELTKKFDLACFAMDDPEVCSFVVQNFKTYADLKDTFLDEHGRAQTILERLYACLHRLNIQQPFVKATPEWCLMNLIYQYIYAEKA